MNIYNKVTLSVILVITIIISFIFILYNREKVDKDKLYENKITNHKQAGKPKIMVSHLIIK